MTDSMTDSPMPPGANAESGCFQAVQELFPDICPLYLDRIAATHDYADADVIHYLVGLTEKGGSYERAKRVISKRKRDSDAEEDLRVRQFRDRYCSDDRRVEYPGQSLLPARDLLANDFPDVRKQTILSILKKNQHNLAPAYLELAELVAGDRVNPDTPKKWKKRRLSYQDPKYGASSIAETIEECKDLRLKDLLKELHAARHISGAFSRKGWKEREAKEAEEAEKRNVEEAKASGDIAECECCFSELPTNRLVCCNGEEAHRFCYDCARRNVETAVGLSKYQFTCMSMDGCEAGFSREQRFKFIDEKLEQALEKLERDTNIRLAGIENLVSCPFCDYAAECLPVEVDKEFRCQNLECKIVSCRLCQKETHIPLSCAEVAKKDGEAVRHNIEEAMTAALLRNCNKCGTPFIKESGCNKMSCPLPQCRNIQCYVCSKSCDYGHFDDPKRGGKVGNCPLFDVTEKRHDQEVKDAEAAAKKEFAEKFPHLDPASLDIKMSSEIEKDDEMRRSRDPTRLYAGQRAAAGAGRPWGPVLGPGGPVFGLDIPPFPFLARDLVADDPIARAMERDRRAREAVRREEHERGRAAQLARQQNIRTRLQMERGHGAVPYRWGLNQAVPQGPRPGLGAQNNPYNPHNPQRDWLRQLQDMNLGFGPMQAMNFGRAIGENDQGPRYEL